MLFIFPELLIGDMYYETIDIVGKRAEKRESEKEVLRDGAYVIDCVQSESVYVRTFDMGD